MLDARFLTDQVAVFRGSGSTCAHAQPREMKAQI
jgi:hypothetical protein